MASKAGDDSEITSAWLRTRKPPAFMIPAWSSTDTGVSITSISQHCMGNLADFSRAAKVRRMSTAWIAPGMDVDDRIGSAPEKTAVHPKLPNGRLNSTTRRQGRYRGHDLSGMFYERQALLPSVVNTKPVADTDSSWWRPSLERTETDCRRR